MLYTIGFITSKAMSGFLIDLESDLKPYCRIIHLVSQKNENALQHYRDNVNNVDCFVFSGRMYYYALADKHIYPEKPFFILDEFDGDVSRILLQKVLQDRKTDFSRMYVDCAFERNNYLGLKDLLPEEQWPYFPEPESPEAGAFIELNKSRYLKLMDNNKIDFAITRFGTLTNWLEEKKLPYAYLYPGKEYVLNFFMQIVSEKQISEPFIPAVLAVHIMREQENSSLPLAALTDMAKQRGFDITIQKNDRELIVLTQKKDLKTLTAGFSNDNFKYVMETITESPLQIGMGSGKNYFQAKQNARIALDTSRKNRGQTYYASDLNEMIGPLEAENVPIYKNIPDNELILMSKKYHVDHRNLQKIMNFVSIKQSEKFTAGQLSEFLGITVRSTSRLMNRLAEYGGAETFFDNPNGGRGRPVKYYQLLL